jgi:hypothetical protein
MGELTAKKPLIDSFGHDSRGERNRAGNLPHQPSSASLPYSAEIVANTAV